jgi:hypothetical protein
VRLTGHHTLIKRQLQESVLHDLTQRGVNPILTPGEIHHSLAMGDRLNERRYEKGSFMAKDVSAEKGPRRRIGVELAEAVTVLEGPSVRGITIFLRRFHVLATIEVLRAYSD